MSKTLSLERSPRNLLKHRVQFPSKFQRRFRFRFRVRLRSRFRSQLPFRFRLVSVCGFGFRFGMRDSRSVRFGSVRFGSVRFGSVRFGSVRFGSVQVWFRSRAIFYARVRLNTRYQVVIFESGSGFGLGLHVCSNTVRRGKRGRNLPPPGPSS